jgi:hypothetical protein
MSRVYFSVCLGVLAFAGACSTPIGGGAPPVFGGVTSVSPASPTSLLVTWDPAVDPTTPPEEMTYGVYFATRSKGEVYDSMAAAQVTGKTSLVLTGLTSHVTVYVVVRATNKAGVHDANVKELSGEPQTDTSPPSFAGATSAVPIRSCGTTLTWDAATDDKTVPAGLRYLVFLADTQPVNTSGASLVTSSPGATSIDVALPATMTPMTPYHKFLVIAEDAAGNRSTNTTALDSGVSPLSFAKSIQPIVTNGCAPSCHTLNTTSKLMPIMDESYAYDALVGPSTGGVAARVCKSTPGGYCTLSTEDCPMWDAGAPPMLVVPYNGGCSVFYAVVDQSLMPPGGGLQHITQCDTTLIFDWINQGAKNN